MLTPSNTNLAYNFELFDEEELLARKKTEKKPQVKIKTTSIAKSGNMFKVLLGCAAAVLIAYILLTSKATLSEISTAINVDTKQLELAQRENIRLQTELDNMVSLSKVEEFAQQELGLAKITSAQEKHISLSNDDMTEVAENVDLAWYEVVNNLFNGIKEYLGF